MSVYRTVSEGLFLGYVAWRNRMEGSWYISAIVQVFMELAATKNIEELTTKVLVDVGNELSTSR